MRKLNAHNIYESDWDANTKLMYIVRKDHDLNCTIFPFDEQDLPVVDATPQGALTIKYKYLK
jgi:hypothetical protein